MGQIRNKNWIFFTQGNASVCSQNQFLMDLLQKIIYAFMIIYPLIIGLIPNELRNHLHILITQ